MVFVDDAASKQTFTLGLFRGGVIDKNYMVRGSRSTTWFKVQGQRSRAAAILDYPSNILLPH